MHDNPPCQHIELSNVNNLYFIQQAKPRKGNTITNASVQAEIYGTLEAEEPADRDRTRLMLPKYFPQPRVPHMRFQRLTQISPNIPLTELAMRLWTGGRLFLKHLYTDESIWFRQLSAHGTGTDVKILLDQPNEAILQAPVSIAMETVRLCAAQFGAFHNVEEAAGSSRQHLQGVATYRIKYYNSSSAVMAHEVIFHLASGGATMNGRSAKEWRGCGRDRPPPTANTTGTVNPFGRIVPVSVIGGPTDMPHTHADRCLRG